jgi:hypothetical protein
MHTSLRVIGVLPDLEMSVVLSLDLGGWTAAKAVYEPSLRLRVRMRDRCVCGGLDATFSA